MRSKHRLKAKAFRSMHYLLTLLVAFECCLLSNGMDATSGFPSNDQTETDNKQCEMDGTCSVHSSEQPEECGLWLALSSLPGTGIGMFAGRSVARGGDMVPGMGDHIVPIVDFSLHHEGETFLWDEYTWSARYLRADNLGKGDVNVASSGFGAAANSFMDFLNVDEGIPKHSVAQNLHRSKDPGAGAFTAYHSRKATARIDVEPGQEIFVSYGDAWFRQRENLGPIPIMGDHGRAEKLYKTYELLKKKLSDGPATVLDNAWDTFVLDSVWPSRVIAALPDKKDYKEMVDEGLKAMKRKRMARSQDWLQQHGACADNFFTDESTIPQAGHGAFARRFLKEGSVILPIPLIHIPDRKVMEMYEIYQNEAGRAVNRNNRTGYQLLLNYCLGHRNSSILLSPYGPAFNLINHNQTQANVRLQWASPERSNHHPEMLKKSLKNLARVKSSQIAMELVALRDIQPNEEIFLDYGDEWENAWQEHVRTWKPVAGAENYISALEMDGRQEPLRTEFEQLERPYPSHLTIRFDRAFHDHDTWKNIMKEGGDLRAWAIKKEADLDSCEILRYKEVDGRILYTAVIPIKWGEKKKFKLVENVPREAFMFVDRAYSSDMFLPNAFRHDIRIPDDIFPEVWISVET